MDDPSWQQLYINAEHDNNVGVISIGRESYNCDVDAEMNRAIDWLKGEGIERVILSGDFHLSTQLIGADTSDFFPALEKEEKGFEIASSWSRTARRLNDEFKVSVGVINGKRCLGGMLELMTHCHYLVALEDADLGMPEVTLPVVPGMEGCHWPFRKAKAADWGKLLNLLLTGRSVKGNDAVGWLVDYSGGMNDVIKTAWQIASGGDHGIKQRPLEQGALKGVTKDMSSVPAAPDQFAETARKAIADNITASCEAKLGDALDLQAKHSAGFMTSKACQKGAIGTTFSKTMTV
jgi:enoyl-CoA hydratase/carnithine racemase